MKKHKTCRDIFFFGPKKGPATFGKSQYLILLSLDCVCSTSCIGEAWQPQKDGGRLQRAGGLLYDFSWSMRTLKLFVD